MSDIVKEHLRRWASTRFAWGVNDCLIVIADYVLDVTGKDGAAHLRGRYSTRDEMIALTAWESDPVAVVEDCTSRAGLCRTDAPKRGDIGLLRINGGYVVGAIRLNGGWAVNSLTGVLMVPADTETLAAWAVPCGS